mgnify:CR=1 FL=1
MKPPALDASTSQVSGLPDSPRVTRWVLERRYGQPVSAVSALGLVYASLLVYLLPILAVVCVGLFLSTVTRNSAAAIVGGNIKAYLGLDA